MGQEVFIFIGRSGVGKGTQIEFFKKYLAKKYPQKRVIVFAQGERLREFIKTPGYTAQLAKEIVHDKGLLLPEFIAVYNWADFFIDNVRGEENLILDGSPRKLREAELLDEALEFYNKKDVYVVWMRGSREWSTKLLLGRGRDDDTSENVKRRLDWFEKDIAETIKYFKKNKKYTVLEINAEQTKEEVHNEIVSKIEKRLIVRV